VQLPDEPLEDLVPALGNLLRPWQHNDVLDSVELFADLGDSGARLLARLASSVLGVVADAPGSCPCCSRRRPRRPLLGRRALVPRGRRSQRAAGCRWRRWHRARQRRRRSAARSSASPRRDGSSLCRALTSRASLRRRRRCG
jgi:hypothetical protein